MAKRRFSLFLLREGVSDPLTSLRESPEKVHSLRDEVAPDGKLVVKTTKHPAPPRWRDFVQSASADPIETLNVASSSAVLFIPAEGRWFAFAFGYGRALLDEGSIEPMFGLKVVVNRVDAENLRSIDIRTFQASQFQIRQQAAGATPLDAFGLNVRRDILNAVAGKPVTNELGSSLAGRDSLSVSADLTAAALPSFCSLALAAFKDTKYKERFGWIDTLRPIKDPRLESELDQIVIERLKNGEIDDIDLAVPDILDPERLSGFRFSGLGAKTDLYTDLDLVEMLGLVNDKSTITAIWLKTERIAYYLENDAAASGNWPLYRCLTAQTATKSGTYVLSLSQWYEVEPSYVNEVDVFVADRSILPFPEISFPDNEDESNDEPEYNAFSASLLDMRCQDQQFVYLGGQRNKVEPCDLLSRDGKMIHVKRKTRSSTLSHLFAQARVSAELLRREKTFVSKWLDQIKKDKNDPNSKQYLHSVAWPCNPAKHEVILVVLSSKPEHLPEKLPFFARIELMGLVQSLTENGFRVSFAGAFERTKTKPKPKPTRSKKAA